MWQSQQAGSLASKTRNFLLAQPKGPSDKGVKDCGHRAVSESAHFAVSKFGVELLHVICGQNPNTAI
jgi:hypothetical protein